MSDASIESKKWIDGYLKERPKKGFFLSIEGPDGSGKTTHTRTLVEKLRSHQIEVVHTREPGGTEIAEDIRNVLLKKRDSNRMGSMTELLLFMASRAEHIEKLIYPSLAEGKVVISDRFSDTTFAYQAFGRRLYETYLQLENLVYGKFQPDLTLFFDVPLEVSERRLKARSNESNRLDVEEIEFKKRCFEGYQRRCTDNKNRIIKIDANRTLEEMNEDVELWTFAILRAMYDKKKLSNSDVSRRLSGINQDVGSETLRAISELNRK